jgi:hypothetical protein
MEHTSIQALSELTADELRERVIRSDTANFILSGRLSTCETQLGALRAFKESHEKVWGALTADELALFVKCERALMEQNPDGFLCKYHDALFCRDAVEAAKAECRSQTNALLERVQVAEEEASRVKEDLATAHRLLVEQKQQTHIQCERAKVAEEQAEAVQLKWRECNVGWRRVGEENDALGLRVRVLMEENVAMRSASEAMASEVAALRSDPLCMKLTAEYEARLQAREAELVSRHRAEVDCVAASLYEQIRALKRGRH